MGACLPRRCVHACIRTHTHTNTHTYTHTCHTPHTVTCTLSFVNALGKINLENAVTRWKWGVVRLIAESTIVIPLWHVGMEDILPARSPYIPQLFKVRVARLIQLSLCTTAGGQDYYHAGPLSGPYCWCRHVVPLMVQSEISALVCLYCFFHITLTAYSSCLCVTL